MSNSALITHPTTEPPPLLFPIGSYSQPHSITPITPAIATSSPPALNAKSAALLALELALALAVDEATVEVTVDVPVAAAEPLEVVEVGVAVEEGAFVVEYWEARAVGRGMVSLGSCFCCLGGFVVFPFEVLFSGRRGRAAYRSTG